MYTLDSAIDHLITARRTVRTFTDAPLEREKLEAIIEAGRQAPFAGLVNREVPTFRRFFVLGRDSRAAGELKELVIRQRAIDLERAEAEDWATHWPLLAQAAKGRQGQADDLFVSPTLVVVAERAGLPVREETCMGCILENMWLKATALEVAFTIRSAVRDVEDKAAMKALFGLDPAWDYAFDGCNLGYARGDGQRAAPRENPAPSITYME